MARGLGVGSAGGIVLGHAHLLDRTVTGDVLGNSAIREACFWVGLVLVWAEALWDSSLNES